jgi:hypothetical protein
LRYQAAVHFAGFTEPDNRKLVDRKMPFEVAGNTRVDGVARQARIEIRPGSPDPRCVQRIDGSVAPRLLQGKKCRDERGFREVEQARRRAMMLHHRQAAQVVVQR